MTIAALALVFKSLDNTYRNASGVSTLDWGTHSVYYALSVISIVLFGSISMAYLLKTAMYFKKVRKEWQHPIFGSFFSSITICFSLFGLLSYDYYLDLGISLTWIGAIGQMAISVSRMSTLLYDYTPDTVFTPAVMMGPVGNFVSALALGSCPFLPICI